MLQKCSFTLHFEILLLRKLYVYITLFVTGSTVWKWNFWTRTKSSWSVDGEIRHCQRRSSGHSLCWHASWQLLEFHINRLPSWIHNFLSWHQISKLVNQHLSQTEDYWHDALGFKLFQSNNQAYYDFRIPSSGWNSENPMFGWCQYKV